LRPSETVGGQVQALVSKAIGEQSDRRGEAVEEVLPADRTDLARAVESRERNASEILRDERRVVIRHLEQA